MTAEELAGFFPIGATHPVACGDEATRGYFDAPASLLDDHTNSGGTVVQSQPSLGIAAGTLTAMTPYVSTVTIGALGAEAVADGDPAYDVRDLVPEDDGLLVRVYLQPQGA